MFWFVVGFCTRVFDFVGFGGVSVVCGFSGG